MTTTILPLFWNLSSASKKERVDVSVQLVSALEHFQAQFTPKAAASEASSEEDDGEHAAGPRNDALDALNAADVSYSIRRLVRGLASPRESSRLGFAVALTELLSRIDTVSCSQIVSLVLGAAQTQGSMSGQEERDVLFARLFGLTAVVQSGLLVRTTPLPTSASSAPAASTLPGFREVIVELAALGEKKSWLRESAWWTLGLAIDALDASEVSWKDEAFESTIHTLFVDNKTWTPEKIALTLKLQKYRPSRDWRVVMSPTFKYPYVLNTGNYGTLSRILKEFSVEEDEDAETSAKSKNGSWKAQVHFVWDMLLDELLSADEADAAVKGSFPEFFRVLVDESLFSSTSSPERKYWGFQIFQKALPRVQAADIPMLFTKNFMRSWINHLSNSDRYLHKAAKQVANDIQTVVKSNPTLGFTLILQLTGVHGSHQFDKLTKTKTVETILTSMDERGIQNYIEYLLKQVNGEQSSKETDIHALSARRAWIVEQLAALIRNGAVPKDDRWVQTVLDWFVAHGLFMIRKKSEKSKFLPLHDIPSPVFSEELRRACRTRLLNCLADLTAQTTLVTIDDKASKMAAVASDGNFWVSKVLSTIDELNQDAKHVSLLCEVDEEDKTLRRTAKELAERLNKISGEQREAAKGAELLLSATLLHQYCIDDDGEDDAETLQSCIDAASRMFPPESKQGRKSRKASGGAEPDEPKPVDVLVDTIIGFLEQATAYMRAVANQVFTLLSGSVEESTIDLILAQLERRAPGELAEEEDDEMESAEGDDGEESAAEEAESSEEESVLEDDEDLDEAGDPELRRKIEEALRVNGVQPATGESDSESEEELMDDEQMLAIDDQLAAVFKARTDEKRFGGRGVDAQREATHYKNRVLDLLDTFIKKQPTNHLILRLILPLVTLVTSSGSDEKQLADKTTGILRSRIGKAKDVPADIDGEQATEILRELHSHARKALSADALATLSQCSLFITKCLLHAQTEAPILEAYRTSLKDFITRKASRLNTNFFQDLITRHPTTAWGIRDEFLEVSSDAVNGYRRTQVFLLLRALFGQLPALGDKKDEILEFMTALRPVIQAAMQSASEDGSLTVAQMKDAMKLAHLAVRQSQRVLSQDELRSAWDPSSWEALSRTLVSSEKFKSSTGLHNMCNQLVKLLEEEKTAKPLKRKAKRKAEALADAQDVEAPKKQKKSKV